jgi:hypothetical protein
VTPEEIRAIKPIQTVELAGGSSLTFDGNFAVLREIAAQLAEQNELERAAQTFDRETVTQQQSETEERNALLGKSLAEIGAVKNIMSAPPSLVPVFRIPPPGEQPQHLGCFVLLPDGTYAMAVNGETPGMVPLELEEAQRLIAAMSKPPEGKPS